MIHVCKLCKRILNVRNQQQWREKNKRVLSKIHFSLTFFKDLNFPWLAVKFPDFNLILKNFFVPWPVATMPSLWLSLILQIRVRVSVCLSGVVRCSWVQYIKTKPPFFKMIRNKVKISLTHRQSACLLQSTGWFYRNGHDTHRCAALREATPDFTSCWMLLVQKPSWTGKRQGF